MIVISIILMFIIFLADTAMFYKDAKDKTFT